MKFEWAVVLVIAIVVAAAWLIFQRFKPRDSQVDPLGGGGPGEEKARVKPQGGGGPGEEKPPKK